MRGWMKATNSFSLALAAAAEHDAAKRGSLASRRARWGGLERPARPRRATCIRSWIDDGPPRASNRPRHLTELRRLGKLRDGWEGGTPSHERAGLHLFGSCHGPVVSVGRECWRASWCFFDSGRARPEAAVPDRGLARDCAPQTLHDPRPSRAWHAYQACLPGARAMRPGQGVHKGSPCCASATSPARPSNPAGVQEPLRCVALLRRHR